MPVLASRARVRGRVRSTRAWTRARRTLRAVRARSLEPSSGVAGRDGGRQERALAAAAEAHRADQAAVPRGEPTDRARPAAPSPLDKIPPTDPLRARNDPEMVAALGEVPGGVHAPKLRRLNWLLNFIENIYDAKVIQELSILTTVRAGPVGARARGVGRAGRSADVHRFASCCACPHARGRARR